MTATIIGATGLIGGYVLEELLQDNYYDTVRILIRRPVDRNHTKLEKKLVDFTDAESFHLGLEGSDTVFCTVGTTQKKVKGNKEEYRKVDYDIPVKAARFCKLTGCENFVLISSVGANSKSKNFYLQLKGEVEDAVKAVGLRSVYIIQPSVLLGDRKESRNGEKIAKSVMNAISFLVPSKYKAIQAKEVAKAMILLSKKGKEGATTYQYKDIKQALLTTA